MELRDGGDRADWLFVAMARQRLGDVDGASEMLERSREWLARAPEVAPELEAFRDEAEELPGSR